MIATCDCDFTIWFGFGSQWISWARIRVLFLGVFFHTCAYYVFLNDRRLIFYGTTVLVVCCPCGFTFFGCDSTFCYFLENPLRMQNAKR